MKFCDKLQKLRKENNITQEQLADKLDVSRQAVSKWESGQAYPDMDKMITLTKIFNVSMDELINDKGDEKNKTVKNVSFMEAFEKFLNFISKSFNMFWAMKFMEKIKCIFEMGILILMLVFGSYLIVSVISNFFGRIFRFLPSNFLYSLDNIIQAILYLGCTAVGIVIFTRMFKTRYLDYYIIVNDDSVPEKIKETPIPELKEKKDYKIVIRDPEHSVASVFQKIGKFLLFILKCFCVIMAIPVMLSFIFFVFALVFSLFYVGYGLFFNGISIAIVGALLLIFLALEFMFNLVFNRKHSFTRIFILLIISLSLIGSGLGLSINELSTFKYEPIDKEKYEMETKIIEMSDNLVYEDIMNVPNEDIVIDNNYKDIKLEISRCKQCELYFYSFYSTDYNDNTYKVIHTNYTYNDIDMYKEVLESFKNKKISYVDNNMYMIDKVYISQANLTKIKDNYFKYGE